MTVVVGEQIQASTGEWAGSPTSFSYQWQSSSNGTTGWTNIAATRSDYIPDESDLGLWFRAGVSANNSGGASATVYSAAVGPIGENIPDEIASGSRRRNRRSQGGARPHGRIRRA